MRGMSLAQLELLAHPRVVVEAHVRDVLELRPAELPEQPRLADLARAPLRMSGLRRGPVLPGTTSSFMRNRSTLTLP